VDALTKSGIQSFAINAFLLFGMALCSSCLPDEPYKIADNTQPQQLNDGWDIARPESVNISRVALENVYAQLLSEEHFFNVTSLLIAKNGRLVFEAYVRDPQDRDRFTHVVSVTKSVTSLVFGIIMSEGHVESLDQTLHSIMPEKFPPDDRKKTITLRHLLTMTSGLLIDNDDFSVELFIEKPADPAKYFLEKPLYATPGERFYYRDVDPHLLSYALQRLTGASATPYTSPTRMRPSTRTGSFPPLMPFPGAWSASRRTPQERSRPRESPCRTSHPTPA